MTQEPRQTGSRTGARLLADALRTHGVDRVFCVPGESYLAVLDALYDHRDAIDVVVCRHESGAANMADAYGKLTGRPGICFVTRGPGATNASIGLHTAQQDSTPVILFVGQVGLDVVEREAFQEIDYRRMFGPLTKWTAQIDRADRVPEYVARAFQTATTGRPGPVCLALPEDMLTEIADVPDGPRWRPVATHPGAQDMAHVRQMLGRSRRPLIIVGGGGWSAQAAADVQSFAERSGVPVAAEFRCQDYVDNDSPAYVGDVGIGINPKLAATVREADLILAIGARLGEMASSSYSLFDVPRPRQQMIHVQAGPEELGRVYQADLLIHASSPAFCAALRELPPLDGEGWRPHLEAARAAYLANLVPAPAPERGVDMAAVVRHLADVLPPDAIITNGAGNYTTWVHRFYRYRRYRTQLAPVSGAMGYGMPAAVAAKIQHPERMVVCLAGDGCFLMTGQELATAIRHEAPLVVLVVNNGMYGTIRMHQERHHPGREIATALTNPDFAAYARAFGAFGARVERTEDFPAAFEQAIGAGKPALIELMLDPDVINTRTTLSAIRAAAMSVGSRQNQ